MWKKDKAEGQPTSDQQPDVSSGDSQPAGALDADIIAFVGKGVEFKGTITYEGTVRIDGVLDGEIHTDGTLIVGVDATITAKITAGTIVCRGRITGDMVAREKIKLLAPAMFNGSVKTPMLSMEEGVLFNGNCEMARAEVRELPREGRESVVRAVNAPPQAVKRLSV